MLGLASGISSLARFAGPILTGLLYDLAQSRGAFFGGASLTLVAFLIAFSMRRMALTSVGEPSVSA